MWPAVGASLSLAVPAKSDREYMTGKIRSTGKDLTNQKAAPGQKVNFPVICNLPDQSEASIPVNRGFNTVLGRLGLNWPFRGSSRSEMYFPGLALVVRPIRKLHSGWPGVIPFLALCEHCEDYIYDICIYWISGRLLFIIPLSFICIIWASIINYILGKDSFTSRNPVSSIMPLINRLNCIQLIICVYNKDT